LSSAAAAKSAKKRTKKTVSTARRQSRLKEGANFSLNLSLFEKIFLQFVTLKLPFSTIFMVDHLSLNHDMERNIGNLSYYI